MKYEVLHSYLFGPSRNFKRGEIVSAKELKDAGFDPDFLLKNDAVEPVKGTEYDDALSMTTDAGADETAPNAGAHARRSGKS